jgi:glycosyltransferase involved in cell wall biosynthesis
MIRVFVTLFNTGHLLPRCLESIAKQTTRFKCYIVDDCSTDDSATQAESAIFGDARFLLVTNQKKLYQTGCYDSLIRDGYVDDEDVCVAVDSDDYLIGTDVFDRLGVEYDKGALITHGSYVKASGASSDSLTPPYDINKLRYYPSVPSHLRTWKASLWKKMPEGALKSPQGEYWRAAGDLAFMYTMMEMAYGKIGFIDKPVYCYDDTLSSCNHNKNPGIQKHNDYIIRNRRILPKMF